MIGDLRNVRAAAEEFSAAVRWYEKQHPGLGAEFFDAVVRTTEQIRSHPEVGSPLTPGERTRRVLVPRFPFQIVYHLREDEIVIVAVAHLRRRPGYWKDREQARS